MTAISLELIGWKRLCHNSQLNKIDQHEPLITYYQSMFKPRHVKFAYKFISKLAGVNHGSICVYDFDSSWKEIYYYYPNYFYNDITGSIAQQVYENIFSQQVKYPYQEISPTTLNWPALCTLDNVHNVIKKNSLFFIAYREHYLLPWEVDLITTKDIPTDIIQNNKLEMHYYYCDIPELKNTDDISILKLAAVRIYTEVFNKTYNTF